MKRFHAANALVFQYAYVHEGSDLENPTISTECVCLKARPGFTLEQILSEIQNFSDEYERAQLRRRNPAILENFNPWLTSIGYDDENIMVRLKYLDFCRIASLVYGPESLWFKKNRRYLIPKEQRKMLAEELLSSREKDVDAKASE